MCQIHYRKISGNSIQYFEYIFVPSRRKCWIKKIFAIKSFQPQRYLNVKSYSLSFYDFMAQSICFQIIKIRLLHSEKSSNGIVTQITFPFSNYIPLTFSKFSKTHLWISLLKTLHQFHIKKIFFSAL